MRLYRMLWLSQAMRLVAAACACAMAACAHSPLSAPYAYSSYIVGINWDFSAFYTQRRAHGSDLWPCAWAQDDNLYCAWGDGGGFEGDADNVGRVSLGFARIVGTPSLREPLAWHGMNVWGAPDYAQHPARFGGKVSSMTAVDGVLYGAGSLWTEQQTPNPIAKSEAGPLHTLIWSKDFGSTWQIAPWNLPTGLGSFLNRGRDGAADADAYVYLYYLQPGDAEHVFLKRVAAARLQSDPATPGLYEYLQHVGRRGIARWSAREPRATPVFSDRNHVESAEVSYDAGLKRYLLTAGHFPSGTTSDQAAGRWGLFESSNPWGPWRTVAYYDNWANLDAESNGDFLEFHLPGKWMSGDGRQLWGVFSGLHELDSFNLARATLAIR